MLFKKDIEPSCTYCRHGRILGGGEVGCVKKGIVSMSGQCKHFSYDPLARKPSKPLTLNKELYDEDSFKID
jgi:hypothetical protein